MYLSCCLLCLSSFLGVMSQTFTQSSSEVKKPGESLKLSCKASGYNYASYYIHWVQQIPGRGLTWIGWVHPTNGNTKYASSFQGRFKLTYDTSITTSYLQIDNLKVEDTATYYCATDTGYGGWYFDKWSPGSFVTVTSASPKAPSLFPLIPCGTSQQQSTTIGCLAMDFLPNSIEMDWTDKANNSFSNGFKKYNTMMKSGNYAACSQVDVVTESWQNKDTYYCIAKHPQGTKILSIVSSRDNNVVRKPIVTIHPPAKDDVEENNNATMACIASGFFPKTIKMEWLQNYEVSLNAVTETISNGDGSFTMTSFITVPKKDWENNVQYSCKVNHSDSKFYEMKNLTISTVCETPTAPGKITVTAVPPSFETIYFQNTAPLTCIISNMETKDGLEVSWFTNGVKINTEVEDPVYNTSLRSYTARAIATVCPEDWKTKVFECKVSHPELPRAESVTLRKQNGQDARTPTVLIYPPHPDELAKKETVSFICVAKGVSPPDYFFKWMDSDNVEQTHVVTTGPVEEITSSNKKTYTIFSTLTLSNVEAWASGKSISCIFGHDSLPLHTIQRTVDKTSGKPSHVNVSLVMSDFL